MSPGPVHYEPSLRVPIRRVGLQPPSEVLEKAKGKAQEDVPAKAPAQTLDWVAVEAPLQIVLDRAGCSPIGMPFSVTMRTPGRDPDLARGLLYSEGIIDSAEEITRLTPCQNPNRIRLELLPQAFDRAQASGQQRRLASTSSCGFCGKQGEQALEISSPFALLSPHAPTFSAYEIESLPGLAFDHQSVFRQTGGTHACAWLKPDRSIEVAEDVGRHNALDKLIGRALQNGDLPCPGSALLLSGRVSFEMMQKSIRAGVFFVIAIGAPTSLAVELAQKFNVTLVAFLSRKKFNVYSHPKRVST